MTFEQRMAELGVDLSDLPKSYPGGPEAYGDEARLNAQVAAWLWYLPDVLTAHEALMTMESRRDVIVLRQYILHLTDIIDRMETRLGNLTVEKDYLQKCILNGIDSCCEICMNNDLEPHKEPCNSCLTAGEFTGNMYQYEFAGVPEDWEADT